jgi:hypothetical protein
VKKSGVIDAMDVVSVIHGRKLPLFCQAIGGRQAAIAVHEHAAKRSTELFGEAICIISPGAGAFQPGPVARVPTKAGQVYALVRKGCVNTTGVVNRPVRV